MAMTGDSAERTAELAERALSAVGPARFTMSDWAGQVAMRSLVLAERFDAARRALEAAQREARARGDAIAVAVLSDQRAELLWHIEKLPEAEAEASSGHAICVEQGWLVGLAALAGRLIDVRLERGEIDPADTLLEDGPFAAPADALPGVYTFTLLLAARGRLRLAQGRSEDALVDLLENGRR